MSLLKQLYAFFTKKLQKKDLKFICMEKKKKMDKKTCNLFLK